MLAGLTTLGTVAVLASLWHFSRNAHRDEAVLAGRRTAAYEAKVEAAQGLLDAGNRAGALAVYREALAALGDDPAADEARRAVAANIAALEAEVRPPPAPTAAAPPRRATPVAAAEDPPPAKPDGPRRPPSGSRIFDMNGGDAAPEPAVAPPRDEPPPAVAAADDAPPPPAPEAPVVPVVPAVELKGVAASLVVPGHFDPSADRPESLRALMEGDAEAAARAAVAEFRDDVADPYPAHVAAVALLLAGRDEQAASWADRAADRWERDGVEPTADAAANVAAAMLPDSPMKAALYLLDRVDARSNPGDPDPRETARLNAAAGTAVQAAWERGLVGDALFDALARMRAADRALASGAGRPGQARFGDRWMPAAEAGQKWDALDAARRDVAAAADRVASAEAEYDDLEGRAKRARRMARIQRRRDDLQAAARAAERARDAFARTLESARDDLAEANRALDRADKPAWPRSIPLSLPVRGGPG